MLTADTDRITEIINRLEALTIETTTLTTELRQLHLQTGATVSEPIGQFPLRVETFAHGITVGDKVVITNNYKFQRGVIGTAVRVGETTIVLVDSAGREYQRKYTNVRNLGRLRES